MGRDEKVVAALLAAVLVSSAVVGLLARDDDAVAVEGAGAPAAPPAAPAPKLPPAAPAPAMRLLVHMHYYERGSMAPCDLITKRTNLAVFLDRAVVATNGSNTGAHFYITANGDQLPSIGAFYQSIFAPVPPRGTLIPAQPNVEFEHIRPTPSDLCARHPIIQRALRTTPPFTHLLFLNDGVRGPLAPDDQWVGQPPLWWVQPFAAQMEQAPDVAVVGGVISCQIHLHVQSWAMLVRVDVLPLFVEPYARACAQSKSDGIRYAEVGLMTTVLASGVGIAGLLPMPYVAYTPTVPPSLRNKLFGCQDPMRSLYQTGSAGAVSEVPIWTKFGEAWRLHWYAPDFLQRTAAKTEAAVGTRGCVAPE